MKQVDKYFKKKLANHESPVPDDMWSRIAPALEENNRRLAPLFWKIGIATLFFAGALAMYFTTGSSSGNISASNLSDNTIVATSSELSQKSNDAMMVFNEDNSSIDAARSILNEYTLTGTKLNPPVNSSKSTRSTTSVIEKKGINSQPVFQNIQQVGIQNNNTFPKKNTSSKTFELKITKSYFEGKDIISDINTTMTLSNKARAYLQSVTPLSLPISNISQNTLLDKASIFPFFGKKSPQCPSFINKKRVGFFVDAYISHELPFKYRSGNQEYIDQRKETESSTYSYGGGLRFSYFLGRGFGVRSGIDYSQINETFSFDDPDAISTKTVITIQEDIINGDTIRSEKHEVVEITGRHIVTNGNKYHFLNIPVLLFYEFGNGDSPFYFSLNGGTNINVLFTQEGKYISVEGDPTTINGDVEYPNPYRSTVGVSLYASVGIHYTLSDAIDLTVEPHFTTQLKSMTRADHLIQERFTTVGLNTGIRYKF